jgi:hypothetical protein
MAFGQLSDVGLRRLAAEAEEHPNARYTPFLNDSGKSRALPMTLSAAIQIQLVIFSIWSPTFHCSRLRHGLRLSWRWLPGLILAGIFRQFLPRLFSLRNPEENF